MEKEKEKLAKLPKTSLEFDTYTLPQSQEN
jgi:hypothetical protein